MSCDAVSVLEEIITENSNGMCYHLTLKGFGGLSVTYTLYAANAANITKDAIYAQGVQIVSVDADEDLLKIEVVFEREDAAIELKLD